MRLALRALIVIALVLDTARATNAVLLMVAAVRAAAAVSLRLSNCAGQSANLPSDSVLTDQPERHPHTQASVSGTQRLGQSTSRQHGAQRLGRKCPLT